MRIFRKKKKEEVAKPNYEQIYRDALLKKLANPVTNKRAKVGFYILVGLIVVLFIIRQF